MKTLFFAASLVAAYTLNAADFRNATWGMSPEQIIKSEKIKLKKDFTDNTSSLDGKCKLLGLSTDMTYMFSSNKLCSAYYNIDLTPSAKYTYAIKIFYAFKKVLKNKYRTPATKSHLLPCYNNTPKKELTIDDLKNGTAKLTCKWKTQKTDIELKLWRITIKHSSTQIYLVSIFYDIANSKKVLTKWNKEDIKNRIKQTESQL